MAKTSVLLPFQILLVHFFLRISPVTSANVTSEKGLSFQVLYSDVVRYPSLYANLTTFQRLERIIQSSESYFQWLRRSRYNTIAIRPKISPYMATFTVAVSIGTPPGTKSYTLDLHTANSFTWIQCIPCNPSFPQTQPMFNPTMSPSYQFLPSTNPLCQPPLKRQDNKCFYNIRYFNRSEVAGVVSTETFTVHASPPSTNESIHNLIFGCTHSSHIIGLQSGILGMDRSPLSFASQVSRATNGRFSYCFFPSASTNAGFLRFGNDIVMQGRVQRTPFINIRNSTLYHLELHSISLDNQRINVPASTFAVTWIGTGTMTTRLIRPAYAQLRQILVQYFDRFHLVPFQRPSLPFDLCYNLPRNMTRRFFRSMTWNFRRADLVIRGEELFYVDWHDKFFCLGIVPDDRITTLGVLLQYNTRFTYDLNNNELLFAPEDCSHDGGNL